VADKGFAVDHHGVTGIVSTLEPDHIVRMLAEQVHDFAFAFIPPLGPDYHCI
jgi:hypothetical protein